MQEDTEIKKAIEFAKKKMPDFDTIIDLFEMKFVYITEEAAKVSGYKPEEMVGKHISKFMAIPNDTTSFRETIVKSMIGGLVKIPIKNKEGEEKVIEMKHDTIDVNGHTYLITKAVI